MKHDQCQIYQQRSLLRVVKRCEPVSGQAIFVVPLIIFDSVRDELTPNPIDHGVNFLHRTSRIEDVLNLEG
jgi:hypothetical protein